MSDTSPLESYRRRLAREGLAPLWDRIGQLLPPEPRVRAVPHRWRYASLRPVLLEAATVISADEAERRVLILENPGLPGESAATDDLFAGLQLLMPGEVAPAHRHTPAALRFILESDDAYTSVDGEPVPMQPGDLVLTPAWRWHAHSHTGAAPVIWLDVLDLPLVRALGPRFAERDSLPRAPIPGYAGRSEHAFGSNLAPAGRAPGESLLRYPFERSSDSLDHLRTSAAADPCHGFRLEYTDPTTGGAVLPTISAYLQLLPAGFESATYRTTAGTLFYVQRGSGTLHTDSTGDHRLDYAAGDMLVVPCWQPHRFAVHEETVLFSASDRAAQIRLGLWRESRGTPK